VQLAVKEKKLRVKWWSVVPLLVLATGCTPKGIQTPAPVHSEFPQVQEQGTLVVGVKPCRNPADCEGVFSVDPTKFGLLPLRLAIENTSGRPYIFSKTYTEIITSGGRRVPPLYFDQMLDLTQEVSERERAPLWRRLLQAGHKDAAAIYCRVALEVSLRSLCRRSDVGFEEGGSINGMAQSLRDASVISPEEWKAIQRWATLANTAAYQKFSQYRADKVEEMVDWLEDFTRRTG